MTHRDSLPLRGTYPAPGVELSRLIHHGSTLRLPHDILNVKDIDLPATPVEGIDADLCTVVAPAGMEVTPGRPP